MSGNESDELYFDDMDELPIAELRASVHNIFTQDVLANLPLKVQKMVIRYLPTSDSKDCRLVSRNWNTIFVKFLKFNVELSDLSRYTFLPYPSLEKLTVTKMVTRNLSKITNPLNPREILNNFRMKSSHDIRTLIFREGTTKECQLKILQAYRWIEKLKFRRVPFPTFFPPNLQFPHLKKLEIITKVYTEGPEMSNFFKTVHIPTMESLKLEFYCRNDILNYLGAHYFAAIHYKNLLHLSLNFGYYLADVDKFSKDQVNSTTTDTLERNEVQNSEIKLEKEYYKLKSLILLMKLESLELHLSLNEGHAPWTLSYKLIDVQKDLRILDIRYPSILNNFNFNTVIQNNCQTLEKISVPCLVNFDCSILEGCSKLSNFSIGREFSFNYLFFGNRGSLVNFNQFPTSQTLMSVSICVPLSKKEVSWLSSNIPCHSLLVYGIEHEFFSVQEVTNIINERQDLTKLMMRIYMTNTCNDKLSKFFDKNEHFTVIDHFHTNDCGFTTFVLEKSLPVDLGEMDYGYSETVFDYNPGSSLQSLGQEHFRRPSISIGLQSDF